MAKLFSTDKLDIFAAVGPILLILFLLVFGSCKIKKSNTTNETSHHANVIYYVDDATDVCFVQNHINHGLSDYYSDLIVINCNEKILNLAKHFETKK